MVGTINYGRSGDMVVIEIRDYSGAKIETFKCSMKDKRKYGDILRYLKEKYGFEPEVKKITKDNYLD